MRQSSGGGVCGLAGWWVAALCLAGLLGASLYASPAAAQRMEGDRAAATGVYEGEVPVNGQTESERRSAFARALLQVLGKISGDRNASARPGFGRELRRAEEYVQTYDYRQDQSVSPTTGATRFTTMLVVRFDSDRVDEMVSALGLPIWPQPRPKPVLWLAIDDGKGPRLVGVGQSNAARSILDKAVERGYRLGLPSGTAAEQAAVGAIWRGDTATVARISARYAPPMQLLGKLYRKGSGWKADWVFVDDGRVLSRWSTENADARRAMAGGAEGAADALIRRYARRPAGSGNPGTYRVAFEGVRSGDDYVRLLAHLQDLPVVRAVRPVVAGENRLVADLELTSGLPGFRRFIAARGVLVAMDARGDEGEAPADGTPPEATAAEAGDTPADAGGDTLPVFRLR